MHMDMNMNMSTQMVTLKMSMLLCVSGAAQARDYQSGLEPSASINLALSHRQDIDMIRVQTYLPVRSDTIHGSCSPLALIPDSPTNSHSNPR